MKARHVLVSVMAVLIVLCRLVWASPGALAAGNSLLSGNRGDVAVNMSGPVSTTGVHRYAVDGGFISGALIPIASPLRFRGTDTYFALDPAAVLRSIVHPSWFIVQGVAEPGGGWAYPHQASPNVGTGILRIGVAVNDANHTQLLAAGAATPLALASLPSAKLAASPARSSRAPQPLCPSVPGRSLPSPNSCYSLTRYVTQDTWWEDPASITVMWVSTQLVCDEYYPPSIVYCSASSADTYYAPSGWYRYSHSFNWYYYNSQTWAEADTNAHFRNTQFPACLGQAVDNYYAPNSAQISAWDNHIGSWNTWVSGAPCKNLLFPLAYTSIS
jgi:hypothetical protein